MKRFLVIGLALVALAIAIELRPASVAEGSFAGRSGPVIFIENGTKVVDLRGGRVRSIRKVLDCTCYTPTIFPDGRRFAYSSEREIFVKSFSIRDPKTPGRVVFRPPVKLYIRAISITPDGRRFVFAAFRGGYSDRRIDIYSVRTNGTAFKQLTDNPVFENDPDVSTTGRIAFVRRVHGRGQIFTMALNGTHQRRVTHDRWRNRAPSFSPDGRKIAYMSDRGRGPDRIDIFIIGTSGHHRRAVTNGRLNETWPAFSPGGNAVAYSDSDATDVLIQRLSGGPPRTVFNGNFGGGTSYTDWGPAP